MRPTVNGLSSIVDGDIVVGGYAGRRILRIAPGFRNPALPPGSPAPCSALFDAKTATAIATGSYATAGISAATDCIYQAVSNNSWIQLASGAYGSGNATLTYVTTANPGTASRSGTISLNGQTLTITQDGSPATPQPFTRLSYKVVDAEYDKALDKIVMVSANPDALHVYDPVTGTDQFVALSTPPLRSQSGPMACTPPWAMMAGFPMSIWAPFRLNVFSKSISDVHDLVLSGTGWIYAFPQSNSYDHILTSGEHWKCDSHELYKPGRIARLHPSGNYLYVGGDSSSKWDIGQGVVKQVSTSFINPLCSNFWIAEDGSRIFTACASVLRASDIPAQDLQDNGSFAGATSLRWAAHSLNQQSIVVIPDSSSLTFADEIQIYADANLALSGRLSLPKFPANGSVFASHGQFVFWNAAGSKLFVVAQADSSAQLLSDYAVAVISPSDVTSCIYSITPTSANVPSIGANLSPIVAANDSCIWGATTSVQWIANPVSSLHLGSGIVQLLVSQNTSIASRTGTVSIGNQTYTVTQAGVIGALTLSSNFAQIPVEGGSSSVYASRTQPTISGPPHRTLVGSR